MHELRLERHQDPATRGKKVLKIFGGVTVGEARALQEALIDVLDGASEVQVDLSEVTGMDLSGLQLLCAAHQSAVKGGKWLHITDGGNRELLDIIACAGFSRQVGCARDIKFSCIWVEGES